MITKVLALCAALSISPMIAFTQWKNNVRSELTSGIVEQSSNSSGSFKGAFSLLPSIFGVETLGLCANYYVSDRISLNGGAGYNLDAHLGTNYYWLKRNKYNPSLYTGVQVATIKEFKLFNSSSGERQYGLYVPTGIEFVFSWGFSFQLEGGPNFVRKDYDQANTEKFLYAFRIGYTFKR